MPVLELTFSSGEDSLSVRRFTVQEALSAPFRVDVWAASPNQDIDFSTIVGKPAELHIVHGTAHVAGLGERTWRGVCAAMAQTQAEPSGLASYELTIVPAFALLGQRRDHRMFQHMSIPDIVKEILDAWSIRAAWSVQREKCPRLEMRVQHGESDLDFVSRLLEEAGITYLFDEQDETARVTLSDQPHAAEKRPGPPIPFVDNPNLSAQQEFVTRVELSKQVRPGARAVRDHDFRNPGYAVLGQAEIDGLERRFSHYSHAPGAFLIEGQKGGGTPVADRQSVARHSDAWAEERTTMELFADRTGDHEVAYETNAVDLRPGTVFSIEHAHSALARPLLATELTTSGSPDQKWSIVGRAVFADKAYRPPRRTPKPRVRGVESAVVTGPSDQEIHTDEFGRVRVRFHWDRSGAREDRTSCWLRVSQGWAGAGFGWTNLPRVGQEVLVSYFEDDPDQPIILAGVYNGANPQPHALPRNAAVSVWHSNSTPGGDGYNEVFLDDTAVREVFYLQAQRDLTQLVRRNETSTTVVNVSKLVKGDETQTTGKQRIRVTSGARKKLVKGDHGARVEGKQALRLGAKVDAVTAGSERTLVGGDASLSVHGEERVTVGGTESRTVGEDRFDVALGRHAVDVGKDIHLLSKDMGVVEGVRSITLKTPGGLVLIDAGGIVIKGTLVKINSGGVAGTGGGAQPQEPEPPRELQAFDPPMPYGEPNPDGDAPAPIEAQEPVLAAAPSVELTWIEIRLVDADGKPVGGERYRVIAPDGRTFEGHTDGDGTARIDGIRAGDCRITFPDLDTDDWTEKNKK